MPSSADTPLSLRSSAANGPTAMLAITVATCWQKSKSCFGCVWFWNQLNWIIQLNNWILCVCWDFAC